MSKIRIKSIKIKNYRSFGSEEQVVNFPEEDYKKPISIVGYNNAGKTNLMNCILHAIQYKYVSKDTFSLNDFHNRSVENIPYFLLEANSSIETKFDGEKEANLSGFHKLKIFTDGDEIEGSSIESLNSLGLNQYGKVDNNYQSFGALRYFNVFYINFHTIKDEINTQKSNWGNIRSFLGKHIKKIIDEGDSMISKRSDFTSAINSATEDVLNDSRLNNFIEKIKTFYSNNLRNNKLEIEYGMPDYEDIFLHMIFKVGLNNTTNFVPLNHYGDGYISMFIMAVIQAIAEENTDDKCLFLFEEPESFLHENHQEYFYKVILCGLAEKGHQVIYTTHSARMVDVFETRSLVRLEFDDQKQQTIVKANRHDENLSIDDVSNPIDLSTYNSYIKNIEPNLNKILFSKKVILVEGPNDVMTYNYLIKKIIAEKIEDFDSVANKIQYAETYLNFHNIAIVPHHGKTTAHLLIELCKFIDVCCYVIADWDIPSDTSITVDEINNFESLNSIHQSVRYSESPSSVKSQLTNNWKLVKSSIVNQIHFNNPKLESLIGDGEEFKKDSLKLWEKLQDIDQIDRDLFPDSLRNFLEIDNIENYSGEDVEDREVGQNHEDDIPF